MKGGPFHAIIRHMKRDMSAAVIIREKRLLLVHNTKHGLRIEPPGGKKMPDEGWLESVAREVEEELGIKVVPSKLIGIYRTETPEGDFNVRLYLSEIISGEPMVMEPDKIPAFGWYTLKEVLRFKEEGTLVSNMAEALAVVGRLLE